jgi:succinyl-CoA synthetase beta subunit
MVEKPVHFSILVVELMLRDNEEEGQEILKNAGIPFLKTMEEAASKVVELVKEVA